MRQRVVLACLLLLLVGGLSGATVLVRMEMPELARQAQQVVVGTVVHAQGEWDDDHRFIHTDVTLSVDRYVKGSGPQELTLRTPGGRVGDQGQVAHGAPTFEVGERVLVFLTQWEDGTLKVLGYDQGKSTVFADAKGQPRLRGGRADGLTVEGVSREINRGPGHNIPLRPAR